MCVLWEVEVLVGCSAAFSTKSVYLSVGLETYVWISKKYDEWDFDGYPDKDFYCLYCHFRNWSTTINLTEIAYGLHSQRPIKNSENTHSGYVCGTMNEGGPVWWDIYTTETPGWLLFTQGRGRTRMNCAKKASWRRKWDKKLDPTFKWTSL